MSRILNLVALAGLIALLLAGLVPEPAMARSSPERFVPGEILVKFRSGATGASILEAHRGTRATVRRTLPRVNIDVVSVTPGQEDATLAEYLRNPNVEFAERNGFYSAVAMPNDPQVGQQWHLENGGQNSGIADADIDAYAAWDVTQGNSNVAVAILDTGIDEQHSDLIGKVQKRVNFSNSTSDQDVNGHGTHVAGIVAASTGNGVGVGGVCPSCVLYNVKVLGDDGNGSWSSIISGINWAVDNGARVINMSLGGSAGSQSLASAIDNAWSRGVVVVAAAGNNSSDAAFYPAYYANVIAVASTNNRDQKSTFSNYGTWINVAAPGEGILSTTKGSAYGLMSGTSMASPVVAGLAGLLWSTSWGTSNASVRSRLEGTAESIGGTGVSWSNGRVNACKAVGGSCDGAAGPIVTLVTPSSGTVMNDDGSTQRLQVRTDDTITPEGALSVQFRIDGGVWNQASYNQSRKLYEWSWSLTGVATGAHSVDARATNGAGGVTITPPASVRVTRSVSIPNSFDAKDYYRFYDLSAGNSGGAFWADDVDKQTCADGSGCIAITDIEPGEWLSYRIESANEGDYVFSFRVATPQSNATITALIDDVDVSGAISIASTGSWTTWGDRASSPIHLRAGSYTLKLRFGYSGANPGMLMNLNHVSITPSGVVGTPPPPPPPASPPSVAVSSPTQGTTLGGSVNVTASASGDKGVSRVEFFVDGASIGVDTNSADGWSMPWNSAAIADGARSLTAKATDTAGQATTSTQVVVTVKNNVNQLPVASFTASCNSLACSFDASASSDPDGTIASYAWTFGDGVSGTGKTIGRTYSKAGTYTVTLRVTDNAGGVASLSRVVTATTPPPPPPTTLHIGDIDGVLKAATRTGGTATITILVESSAGATVANATVSGTLTYTGASRSLSCKTGTAGTCSVSVTSIPTRVTSVTFTVTKVTHATLAYKAADNRDPDSDSNGTTIVVRK